MIARFISPSFLCHLTSGFCVQRFWVWGSRLIELIKLIGLAILIISTNQPFNPINLSPSQLLIFLTSIFFFSPSFLCPLTSELCHLTSVI